MTRTLANPSPSPPSQVPGSCSYCQLTNFVFSAQTNSSGKLDSVLKWALAALVIYKSISVIRKRFSRPAHTGHTRSGDPAHNGTCRILDTKITAGLESTHQNDSAEGNSILDTKITAGVELTDQNDSAEDSISGIPV